MFCLSNYYAYDKDVDKIRVERSINYLRQGSLLFLEVNIRSKETVVAVMSKLLG